MTSKRRLVRAALAGSLAVASLATSAVALSPVDLFGSATAKDGRVVEFNWTPPLAHKAAARVAAPVNDADKVLGAVVADRTFSKFRRAGAVETAVYGGPFASACPGLLTDAAPSRGVIRKGETFNATFSVSAWAYQAGLAGGALESIRERIIGCNPSRDPYPRYSSMTTPGNGFVALASNSGDGVAWGVWARGDVIVSITSTAAAKQPPTTALRSLMNHFDNVAVEALNSAGCLSLSVTPADSARNPFNPRGYRGLMSSRVVSLPAGPERETPAQPSPSPTAVTESPDSPPSAATQGPSRERASSVTLPDLQSDEFERVSVNVPVIPETWPADEPFPALSSLEHREVADLLDVTSVPLPDGLELSEPREPGRPTLPLLSASFDVALKDTSGPGCGWNFSNSLPAITSDAALKAARDNAVLSAMASVAAAQMSYQASWDSWVDAYSTWLLKSLEYETVAKWREQLEAEKERWLSVQQQVADSTVAYQNLYQRWSDAQQPEDVPTATPTEFTTPTPTSEPTPAPTNSPSPTPTGAPTPSPTAQPTVTAGPSASPTQSPTAEPTDPATGGAHQ